ncbi:hypothetical protein CBP36_19450 (plasmid) [Acidovorax carolinensis]|uniref:Uncharacterized protein n=1 Tax=Acidovorax carolinensis TaxID=553814 RepID=A0A240UJ50_9BURK|nr:hypothetical protein [Acidovorax carolinensis]ART57084.1 hypothetical protein CBP35_19400 [Acidovorax carolinensis]ART61146.1 hypothetical protein CBP36_19450 [Acidovorax carolinensis]
MPSHPSITTEAIKRLQDAPVAVRLFNGCFQVATSRVEFARHAFELTVEVTHPFLHWQCGDKKGVSLVAWKSSRGVNIEVPAELSDKLNAMKAVAMMSDGEARRLDVANRASMIHTMEELGIFRPADRSHSHNLTQ